MPRHRNCARMLLQPRVFSAVASAILTTISLFIGLYDQNWTMKIVSGTIGMLGILLSLMYASFLRVDYPQSHLQPNVDLPPLYC